MHQPNNEANEFKQWWRAISEEQAKAALTLDQQRVGFEQMNASIPLPENCKVTPIEHNKIKGELLVPEGADTRKAIIYHHGGGYNFGSALSHRHMVARIAAAAGVTAYNMDYKLSPESVYPSALNDAVANYQFVLEQGFSPEQVVVAGESAGGNLTMALLLRLREEQIPLPVAGYLLSPWLDLSQSGESYELRQMHDPMVSRELLSAFAQAYCGSHDPLNPFISPLNADPSGLPPLLIQVGTDEVLLSDSLSFVRKAALAGLDIQLNVWAGMVHAWPLFHTALPTGGQGAIKQAGAWIASQLSNK